MEDKTTGKCFRKQNTITKLKYKENMDVGDDVIEAEPRKKTYHTYVRKLYAKGITISIHKKIMMIIITIHNLVYIKVLMLEMKKCRG